MAKAAGIIDEDVELAEDWVKKHKKSATMCRKAVKKKSSLHQE